MIQRKIMLHVVTSEDGTKCMASCQGRPDGGCRFYGGVTFVRTDVYERHPNCIAAEQAAHAALRAENASARGIRGIYEGS